MAADTSSPAAARIPVVEGAAAAAAPLIASPIPVKSADAAARASGAAITYDDIGGSHLPRRNGRRVRPELVTFRDSGRRLEIFRWRQLCRPRAPGSCPRN